MQAPCRWYTMNRKTIHDIGLRLINGITTTSRTRSQPCISHDRLAIRTILAQGAVTISPWGWNPLSINDLTMGQDQGVPKRRKRRWKKSPAIRTSNFVIIPSNSVTLDKRSNPPV